MLGLAVRPVFGLEAHSLGLGLAVHGLGLATQGLGLKLET